MGGTKSIYKINLIKKLESQRKETKRENRINPFCG
mgnify:CR=1 FL=1